MFEVLDPMCEPVRSTKYSAYVDLFAKEDITIGAGETKIVKLGVKLDLKTIKKDFISAHRLSMVTNNLWEVFLRTHYLEVALRSSLGVKGLIIANGIGIIDLDYPDEIGLIVHKPVQLQEFEIDGCNYTMPTHSLESEFKISKGDKVAQCTLKEHKGYLMGYESDVVRTSGFGSTGK